MKSKFEKYEIVKVIFTEREGVKKILGMEGYILTKAKGEAELSGTWCYLISFNENTHFLIEEELESTGKFADPKELESVGTLKVIVTPDGKGSIKDE